MNNNDSNDDDDDNNSNNNNDDYNNSSSLTVRCPKVLFTPVYFFLKAICSFKMKHFKNQGQVELLSGTG